MSFSTLLGLLMDLRIGSGPLGEEISLGQDSGQLPQTSHPSPLCVSLWDCCRVEELVFLSCEGFDSERYVI